jgi:hypothetical protein
MATTSNTFPGNGTNKLFTFVFDYLDTSDIDVYVNGTLTTAFTFAGIKTIEFATAPANGAVVLIKRTTSDADLQATFFAGSSIKAADLNTNFKQSLYIAQETVNDAANQSTAGLQAQITAATNTANTANTTANSAVVTANGIAGTANTALLTANAAASIANTASGDAAYAQVVANGAVLTANNASATANSASNQLKNFLINGNFDVWQRGTSFSGAVSVFNAGLYTVDRWLTSLNGTGGTFTVSQQPITYDIPNFPSYFLRSACSVAATGSSTCFMEQRIENVITVYNTNCTFSFYAKGTGTLPTIEVIQNFGSGGAASVTTTVASNISLSGTWTKYAYVLTVPSIAGKAIGANNYIAARFNLPLNSTYSFDLSQVQLELGTTSTTFQRKPFATELALCQRYFGSVTTQVPATASPAKGVFYKTSMRTAAAIAGGGTGFSAINSTIEGFDCTQTTSANQTLTFSSEL